MDRPHRVGIESLIEKQMNLWNAMAGRHHPGPEEENGGVSVEEGIAPYIAVSRQLGSQGNELGEALASKLGYQLYDREIVEYIAERANVRVAAVRSLGETWYNKAHDWIAGTVDRRFLACDEYVRHLVEVVTALASLGPSVFLGRGVGFFLPPERGLRIRVVAPLDQRIRHTAEQEGLNRVEAGKLVAQSDTSKRNFIRTYFRVDLCDPVNHDLCLNLGAMSMDQALAACLAAHEVKFGSESDAEKPQR